MARTFTITGIIIKRRNYREADRWLTVISLEKGKIQILAKGLRKITSKRSGVLELFNLVRLQVAAGHNAFVAADVILLNSFPHFRKNLKLITSVYELCEVVDTLTPEDTPLEEVFAMLRDFLYLAEESEAVVLKGELLAFQRTLLRILGFWDGAKNVEKFKYEKYVRAFIEEIIEKRLRAPDMVR